VTPPPLNNEELLFYVLRYLEIYPSMKVMFLILICAKLVKYTIYIPSLLIVKRNLERIYSLSYAAMHLLRSQCVSRGIKTNTCFTKYCDQIPFNMQKHSFVYTNIHKGMDNAAGNLVQRYHIVVRVNCFQATSVGQIETRNVFKKRQTASD